MYSYLGYLLFLFLFFPYCIVGPTSMCILYNFLITIIRDSPFSLSLHMVLEPREKKTLIISGLFVNPFWEIFQ